ncbi:DeoR/GlpR family DNA-binding transcription regulator [Carnobacterium sp.]|uniref:DeoR/GlpR family DNA-binding transcription regulator n=1 Tax=Carnobacterium sp. TaxID=48221 RepID=UPI00388F1A63
MLKSERHDKILGYLEHNNFVTVTELAQSLDVSDMTVRRDITELSEKNVLVKLYGGAQKVNLKEKELTTTEKIELSVENKEYIGRVMNSVINDGDVVYIGAGTTILYALPYIDKKELFFITNSMIAFDYLIHNSDYKVQLTGGEYLKVTEEFVGEHAEKIFDNLNIDIAFAATNGIYNDNVTTANELEGSIQKAAFRNAKQTVVVADSSKFNVSDVYTFYKLGDLDFVITDNEMDQNTLDYFSSFGKIVNKEMKK